MSRPGTVVEDIGNLCNCHRCTCTGCAVCPDEDGGDE